MKNYWKGFFYYWHGNSWGLGIGGTSNNRGEIYFWIGPISVGWSRCYEFTLVEDDSAKPACNCVVDISDGPCCCSEAKSAEGV